MAGRKGKNAAYFGPFVFAPLLAAVVFLEALILLSFY